MLPCLLLLICIWVLMIPSLAQSELNTQYIFENGATLEYPDTWLLQEQDGVVLQSSSTVLYLLPQDDFEEKYANLNVPAQILREYLDDTFELLVEFDVSDVVVDIVGGNEFASYSFLNALETNTTVIVFQSSDGSRHLAEVASVKEILTEEPEVFQILASYQVPPPEQTATPTPESTASVTEVFATATPQPTVIIASDTPEPPCTIQSNPGIDVNVRVGPGTNRGILAFLPREQSFEVIGKAIGSDGFLWWQLDREGISNNPDIDTVWVSDVPVQSSGACDLVEEVEAPPFIQADSPQSLSESNPSASNTFPINSGVWTLYTGQFTVSCADSSSSYASSVPAERVNMQVDSQGNISIGGNILINSQPDIYFSNNFDYKGTIGSIQLLGQASNRLNGQMSFSGGGCLITTPVTLLSE